MLVEIFKAVPILEAGAEAFGCPVARSALEPTGGVGLYGTRDLVADDTAVPLAEIGGVVTRSAQFGGGAGSGGFKYIEETSDRTRMSVPTTKDGTT